MQRILGGSPAAVITKLIFLSLLVGAFMSLVGITPQGLVQGVVDLARDLWLTGFEAFGTLGRWLLYGAVVVVPVYVIVRLLSALR